VVGRGLGAQTHRSRLGGPRTGFLPHQASQMSSRCCRWFWFCLRARQDGLSLKFLISSRGGIVLISPGLQARAWAPKWWAFALGNPRVLPIPNDVARAGQADSNEKYFGARAIRDAVTPKRFWSIVDEFAHLAGRNGLSRYTNSRDLAGYQMDASSATSEIFSKKSPRRTSIHRSDASRRLSNGKFGRMRELRCLVKCDKSVAILS
jgi:hypothetical protein